MTAPHIVLYSMSSQFRTSCCFGFFPWGRNFSHEITTVLFEQKTESHSKDPLLSIPFFKVPSHHSVFHITSPASQWMLQLYHWCSWSSLEWLRWFVTVRWSLTLNCINFVEYVHLHLWYPFIMLTVIHFISLYNQERNYKWN